MQVYLVIRGTILQGDNNNIVSVWASEKAAYAAYHRYEAMKLDSALTYAVITREVLQ